MIDRKFSKYPRLINWNKRVRDERQRAPNEFLKAGFQFFSFFFFVFFWLVGKSSLVPKMYKEVQGSVSVFWIMQWSQRGARGGKKTSLKPPPPAYIQKTHPRKWWLWLRVLWKVSCQTHQLTHFLRSALRRQWACKCLQSHTIISLRQLRCGVVVGTLGILEVRSGRVGSEQLHAQSYSLLMGCFLCFYIRHWFRLGYSILSDITKTSDVQSLTVNFTVKDKHNKKVL